MEPRKLDETLLNNLPGTRDLLPGDISRWQLIEDRARWIFALYGFQEIRTPLIEATELFARGIGGDTDIVGKEMYTFVDQSGRSITLRPEATASVVRAYAQHAMYRAAGVTKLYYIGPMFRHEKKQRGRWRQFYQIGAEVLGSDHPAIETEVVEMILRLLDSVGVSGRLLINSVGCEACRPSYIEILRRELRAQLPHLCDDCRRRSGANSLRVLDCKVESCQPHIDRLPAITDHLCPACADHFGRFKSHLEEAGIAYQIAPRLVRGLDYYVKTAFEIVSGELGAQNALVGGGRYDKLSEVLGGPPVQGFGFAMGLDRLVMLLSEQLVAGSSAGPDVFLAFMGTRALDRALSIARALRSRGHACHLEFAGGSLKSQMRLANKLQAKHVLIIGDEELRRDQYTIKRMGDSKQWDATVSELLEYLNAQRPPASQRSPDL